MSNSTSTGTTFLTSANTAFDQLYGLWTSWTDKAAGPGFWHMANTMQASVSYIAAVKDVDEGPGLAARQQKVSSIIADCYATIEGLFNGTDTYPGGYWRDDYGWWANAFLMAHQNDWLLGSGVSKDDCWSVVMKLWNSFHDTWCDGKDGCNRNPDGQPSKDTVTNSLYLVLSARLARATGSPGFLKATADQVAFFKNWIQSDHLLDSGKGSGEAHRCNLAAWKPEPSDARWVWIGNQGLLLAGLRESSDPDMSSVADELRDGAQKHLFDNRGVLHEAPFAFAFVDDPLDYVTGKGVLLRYLASSPVDRRACADQITQTALQVEKLLASTPVPATWSDQQDQESFQEKFQSMYGGLSQSGLRWPEYVTPQDMWNVALQANALDALAAAVRVDQELGR